MRLELLAQPGVGFVADDNRCTIIVMRRFKNFGDQIFALIQQDKMRFNLGVRQKISQPSCCGLQERFGFLPCANKPRLLLLNLLGFDFLFVCGILSSA